MILIIIIIMKSLEVVLAAGAQGQAEVVHLAAT